MKALRPRTVVRKLANDRIRLLYRIESGNTKCDYISQFTLYKEEWDNKKKIAKSKNNTYWSKDDKKTKNILDDLDNYQLCMNQLYKDNPNSGIKELMELYKKPVSDNNSIDIYSYSGYKKLSEMYLRYLENKAESTLKNFKTILRKVDDFSKEKKFNISIASLNHDFMVNFASYMLLTSHNEHIKQILKRILAMINYGVDLYKLDKDKLNFFKISKLGLKSYSKNKLALRKKEIRILLNLKLTDTHLIKSRDVFLFMCLTGQRYKDYLTYCKSEYFYNDRFWKFEQDKTNKSVIIPLLPLALKILKKYNNQLPFISNQKMNDNLKKIFKLAGLNDNVTSIKGKGSDRDITHKPMHDVISCHDSRRTFLTISSINLEKFSSYISGHQSNSSKSLYIYTNDDELYDAYLENESDFY